MGETSTGKHHIATQTTVIFKHMQAPRRQTQFFSQQAITGKQQSVSEVRGAYAKQHSWLAW
jgi:hypothetical protein